MFGSQILDVAIGLFFVYLLLSIICSIINETIAKFFTLRAKTLRQGIQNLITGKDQKGGELVELFYNHSLIKGFSSKGKPSYISSRAFALALIDILAPNKEGTTRVFDDIHQAIVKLPESNTKQTLLLLISEAGKDLKKIQENIESWFDDTMDRISGIYKRKIQQITLLVALVVSVGLNVDTFVITNSLYRDETIRSSIVAMAVETAKKPGFIESDTSLTRIKEIQTELQQLRIPMGWTGNPPIPTDFWGWFTKAFGWVLTILALSLGAPFWFDVLNKVVNLRSAGKKPEKSEELEKTIKK